MDFVDWSGSRWNEVLFAAREPKYRPKPNFPEEEETARVWLGIGHATYVEYLISLITQNVSYAGMN
jgi:hypothetical protein